VHLPPCARLVAPSSNENNNFSNKKISCVANKARLYQTDLGANVIDWPKWTREKRKFFDLKRDEDGGDIEDASHDGRMMMQLVFKSGWSIKHVHKCLFDHNPNYHSCVSFTAYEHNARKNKSFNNNNDFVWDDTKHECYEKNHFDKDLLKFYSLSASLPNCYFNSTA
jgi:hypothetical protein